MKFKRWELEEPPILLIGLTLFLLAIGVTAAGLIQESKLWSVTAGVIGGMASLIGGGLMVLAWKPLDPLRGTFCEAHGIKRMPHTLNTGFDKVTGKVLSRTTWECSECNHVKNKKPSPTYPNPLTYPSAASWSFTPSFVRIACHIPYDTRCGGCLDQMVEDSILTPDEAALLR